MIIDYPKLQTYIRKKFGTKEIIPLHEPCFGGNEKAYVTDCIDSTFVSSVGEYVERFEQMVASYSGAHYAIATVNGTAALHIALKLVGVEPNQEVITQPLSFIATCNAISYCGAKPVFVDVDADTLGMCPTSLYHFLESETYRKPGQGCFNKTTNKKITAVVPMHTFGHPCKIDQIAEICENFGLALVEDAAESLGSYYKGKHTGTFGRLAAFSFNGNKTITTGGGGIIVTNDPYLAKRAKHVTTTSKIPHEYEYVHDEIGYNYRMPNLNAALGCAQMEALDQFVANKRQLAQDYEQFFNLIGLSFVKEPAQAKSNYWLNALILKDKRQRDEFLINTNNMGIRSRPIWRLMNKLEMFKDCQATDLSQAEWLESCTVNIPSSVRFS